MLGPVETAPRVIRSWDEALTLIRTRSPDYATSYQDIRRAEAQSRIALAAVLPTLNGQASYTHQFLTQTFGLATLDDAGKPIPFRIVAPASNVWSFGGTLNVPIVNVKGLYDVGTAKRNEDAARLSFSDQRRRSRLRS